MEPHCSLTDPSMPAVVDASVCINVIGTGFAEQILKSLPHDVLLVDLVAHELTDGRNEERGDANLTAALIDAGVISIVKLDMEGLDHFERLVSGSATETLDDGEAATIAFAIQQGGIAVIDERKATRICGERYEWLRVASTIDIFTHPAVQTTLGHVTLSEAVFAALQNARMSVKSDHLQWVVELIGPERTAKCPSLPKAIRTAVETS